MKKIKLFIIILICTFIVNVKADMGPPAVASHDAMITNKSGAVCYKSNDKGDKVKSSVVIPYKTVLRVDIDIEGNYLPVYYKDDFCYIKYADVSAVNQTFSFDHEAVEKITPVKAIVLPSGGINLRKGPSVTYSRITTVPQYTVITVTHRAGNNWYYTTYNGKSGWLTAMNGYLGREDSHVLYSLSPVTIYDAKRKAIGTIPANTPIEKYLVVDESMDFRFDYYVIYNNIKGYIDGDMLLKIDEPGKIKLTKDYVIERDENDVVKKKYDAGKVLEYTMVERWGNAFYVPEHKGVVYLSDDEFEYVKKAKISIKQTGYLGEGLFGEKKEEVIIPGETSEPTKEVEVDDPVIPKEEKESMSTKDIIIIGLLAGIFLALTALVIIKLVNSKKKTPVKKEVKEDNVNVVTDREIEKAKEVINREINKENKE